MTSRERPRCEDAIVFIPGILGSSLVDSRGSVVWGFTPRMLTGILTTGAPLDRLRLPSDGSPDGILAKGLLGSKEAAMLPDLLGISPYTEVSRALREDIALHPDAVMDGVYDWRRSIADTARALKPAIERHLEAWRKHRRGTPAAKLALVCHSMGGLLARYYVDVLGGSAEVASVITLGTPHYGSVKALIALDGGRVLKSGLRHDHVRELVRTLPSIYELAPRYKCVEAEGAQARKLDPADLQALGGSLELARAADTVHQRLAAVQLPSKTRYHVLRGVSQPTFQSVTFGGASPAYRRELGGKDEEGDGTVYRGSAGFGEDTPSPLAQKHGQLASSKEAIVFIREMLIGDVGPPLGQAESPLGFDAPDVVSAGVEFTITINADVHTDVGCVVLDAESKTVMIQRAAHVGEEGVAEVPVTLYVPGLYWIEVKAGGSSPIREMVLAV